MFEFNFDDFRTILDELENDLECLQELILVTHGESELCYEISAVLCDLGFIYGIFHSRSINISNLILKYSDNGGEK